MGKHSSDARWPFYRSIIAWFLPWVLLATVIVGGSWAAVRTIGGDEIRTDPPASVGSPTATAPEEEPEATPSPEPDEGEAEEQEEEQEEPEGGRGGRGGGKQDDEPPPLITRGISMQILNGTSDPRADDRMADRLARHGFRVVALGRASVGYDETTVFWSYPEARRAARRLAARYGWASGPRPSNLSTTVDVHVIVGRDEAS